MGQPQPHMDGARPPVAGAPARSLPTATVDDEDDWEYEYDTTETEDLYFTLDLTTHVPDALVRKDTDAEPCEVQANEPANGTSTGQSDNGEGGDDIDGERVRVCSRHTMQFLDLHTPNPLVKLDDGIYSCYWITDLGTQFHIAQSGAVPKPRREGAVLDIVGTSRCRLIGKPVTLVAKPGVGDPQAQGAAATNAIVLDDDQLSDVETHNVSDNATPGPSPAPGQPLIIPRENCKNLAGEKQASFLERLSAIKLKKGETDTIPMYSVKVYKEPDNMEELKRQALAADAAAKTKLKDEAAALKAERPRKRRKRLTAAERGLVAEGTLNYGGRPDRASMAAQIGLQEASAPAGPSSRPRRAARDKPSRVEQDEGDVMIDVTAETPDPSLRADDAEEDEASNAEP